MARFGRGKSGNFLGVGRNPQEMAIEAEGREDIDISSTRRWPEASADLGYSIGYTLDAVGPVMVSSIVSIVIYQEISGARQLLLFAVSFTCQVVGVLLIAIYGA